MTALAPLQIGKRVGGFLVGSAAAVIACSFATACTAMYIYPRYVYPTWRPPAKVPPGARGFRRVGFLSADGTGLAGWYGEGARARGSATIICCHGWAADKRDMLSLGEALRDSGFNVLLFDFRGWGESDGAPVTFGDREMGDIIGAVGFLKKQYPAEAARIGLIGVSMGAAAALRATAHSLDIAATVADASYARLDVQVGRFFRRFLGPIWPIAGVPARWFGERLIGTPIGSTSPLQAITGISPRPVMIIQGTRDPVVDIQDARHLYHAAGAPKTLWLVEGAGHAESRSAGSAEYDARVIGFFRRYLLGYETEVPVA
jgi:uncharacterized protein